MVWRSAAWGCTAAVGQRRQRRNGVAGSSPRWYRPPQATSRGRRGLGTDALSAAPAETLTGRHGGTIDDEPSLAALVGL